DVDEGVEVVAEDAEVAVDAHVHAGRLEQRRLVGGDLDAALAEHTRDRAVGQDHAADSRTRHGRAIACPAAPRQRAIVYAGRVATTRTIELKTEIPGPRSKAIVERQNRVVASPLALTFPVVVESARGVTLTDVD